ncbi:zinc finger, CCHC-type containing protein [Tanacetum coccineum]
MVAATMKHLALNFAKLNKFKGMVCRDLILNGMSDSLFDIYQNVESSKELWDFLEAKYMAEDASNFNHTLKHNKEELTLVELGSHMCIEESLRAQDSDKPNDNNVVGPQLVHVHFKRMQDMSKDALILAFDMDTENDLCDLHATPSLGNKKYFKTFIDDASRFCYVYLLHTKDEALDKFKVFKTEVELQQGSLVKRFMIDRGGKQGTEINGQFHVVLLKTESRRLGAVVRLPKPKLKTLGERGIECIIVGYAEHSKAFRFYVIEPNESVSINSIIEPMDAIFDENRFSSVSRPSQRSLKNDTEDISGLVVPKEVTKEVVTQQPEPDLRKGKRNRTPKNFGPEFQLYLIEGTRDEVSDQHSYLSNVEDDRKTFDEVIKSQDVAFWKKEINDEMDSILGNDT